jgi:hypothetical protein
MMLKSHHAYYDPNDRPREVPEDKDKQELDDPQTALLCKDIISFAHRPY